MSKLATLTLAALLSFTGAANATVLTSFTGDYSGNLTNAATTSLPAPVTEGLTVDFSFRFTPTTKPGAKDDLDDNDFLGFWFNSSTGPGIGVKANCGTGKCTNDVFVRLGGSDGVFLPGSDLAANTDYRIFGHLYKSEGSTSYDNFAAWLNPTADEMRTLTGADIRAIANVGGAGKTSVHTVNSVGFRTANLDNNVVVSVSDVEVNAVPEPGSIALMGLAMAGLGIGRRRKKA